MIEFVNGGEELLTYNDLINAYNAHDEDGKQFWTYEGFTGHCRDKRGKWEVEVAWDDGTKTWEPMLHLKQDDPLILAKYAHDNDLTDESGWKWAKWLTKDPEKFIRLAKAFAARAMKQGNQYKHGVQVPCTYKEAVKLDELNGNKLWQEAVQKELDQIMDFWTFKVLPRGKGPPEGYTSVPLHLCFDVKFDLRRKARLVAGGNLTKKPDEELYSGVVSIDAVRTALFIAQLNGLEVMAADVGNAYLHGHTKEKIYTIAGPEFGELEGQVLICKKALYGLKTSMGRWHEALSSMLRMIGFKPSKADPDLWLHDAGDHYEYLAVYTDDLLVVSRNPLAILRGLETLYPLKGVGKPEYYLGGDVNTVEQPDGPTLAFSGQDLYQKCL